MSSTPPVTGLLLAAGQGSRMGQPKALVEIDGRTLSEIAVQALLDGGCRDVLMVLGAQAQRVQARVGMDQTRSEERVTTVVCPQWASGISASLRTGLAALAARGRTCPVATLVHLVDLPDIGPEVIARLLERGYLSADMASALARADFEGTAGHPALIGQTHWQGVMDSAMGDRGAGPYLRRSRALRIDCSDLATGHDVDTPADLTAYLAHRSGPREQR